MSLSTEDPLNARSKNNIGNPDTDKGHWVTLDNGKHIFIKDKKGGNSSSSSGSSSHNTNSSSNTNKSRMKHDEVNKKYSGETGGAASVKNKKDNKKKFNYSQFQQYNPEILLNNILNENKPNTKELAEIFLIKPKNIKNHKEFVQIDPEYTKILNSKYGLVGTNKEIGKNWSGFVFKENSSLSKNLSGSTELEKQIQKNYNTSEKQFISNKLDVAFNNPNLKLSLGHATILDPKIDKNGYFHGILFDLYDFKLQDNSAYQDFFTTAANDYFWYKQQRDLDRNFYILVPVKFKWGETDEKP